MRAAGMKGNPEHSSELGCSEFSDKSEALLPECTMTEMESIA